MLKLFIFACIIAFAAAEAKPQFLAPFSYAAPHTSYGSSYYYGSPLAYGYGGYAPAYQQYYAPLAYNYGSYYLRK